MTTIEIKKAIESKIVSIDDLKKELTTMVFENPTIIEEDEMSQNPSPGYIGVYAVYTDSQVLRFAVNESGWLTTYDSYLRGLTEMPCIKSFIVAKENEKLKNKVNELEKIIAELQKCAN